MKKPDTRAIIGIFLILFLIILGTLFIKLMKENSKCKENPFVYGAKETAKQGLEVMCSCIPLDPKYNGFSFDKEEVIIHRDFIPNLNFSP